MRGKFLGPIAVVVLVSVGGGIFWHPHVAPASPALASSAVPTVPTAVALPKEPSVLQEGEALFATSCSSCHAADAQGSAIAPNLVGLGSATIDFWISTGRMPLANPTNQPVRKPPAFNPSQTRAIVAYVASLGPGGPGIPTVNLKGANLALGLSLFSLNCAACHTVTGAGDALSGASFAPSLHVATPTQIAEAIRTGPLQMPIFSMHQLSPRQVNEIVAYVTYLHHPNDSGGAPLGWVGPVTEGFVALLFGVGGLMLMALWVGGKDREA